MFTNNAFKHDDMSRLVGDIIKNDTIRKQVQEDFNTELGIENVNALPHEYHSEYNRILEEKVSNAATAALTNKLSAGMSKKQADTLGVGDKVTVPSGRPGGAGTTYAATKGDSRWRIAQRHLRAGEATASTRNKDDDASPVPKPTTPTPAKVAPGASAAASSTGTQVKASPTAKAIASKTVDINKPPVRAGAGAPAARTPKDADAFANARSRKTPGTIDSSSKVQGGGVQGAVDSSRARFDALRSRQLSNTRMPGAGAGKGPGASVAAAGASSKKPNIPEVPKEKPTGGLSAGISTAKKSIGDTWRTTKSAAQDVGNRFKIADTQANVKKTMNSFPNVDKAKAAAGPIPPVPSASTKVTPTSPLKDPNMFKRNMNPGSKNILGL